MFEYMIQYAETPNALETKVAAAIKENWHPTGGVAVATIIEQIDAEGFYTNKISFYQAMVREGGVPIIIPISLLYT